VIVWLWRRLASGAIGPLPFESAPAVVKRTPQAEKNRGIRAATILADPLIVEALAAIERRAHEAWAGSGAADQSLREQVYWRLRAAAAFRAELEGLVRDGLIAEDEIESNKRLADRRRQQENP
jgi:hypothetical protein